MELALFDASRCKKLSCTVLLEIVGVQKGWSYYSTRNFLATLVAIWKRVIVCDR